jgi:hypothetical protein
VVTTADLKKLQILGNEADTPENVKLFLKEHAVFVFNPQVITRL